MTPFEPDLAQKRALSNTPRLFAVLALAFIEKYGQDAKDLIYKTMYENSYKNGQAMAKKAKNVNDLSEFERLQVEGLQAKGYHTPDFDDPARNWIVRTSKKCVFDLSKAGGCEIGIPDVWKDMGLDADTIKMLGEIYCEPADLATRKGFNEKINFKFTKLAPRGDCHCEWTEELEE